MSSTIFVGQGPPNIATGRLIERESRTPFNTPSTIREYRAELGHLGRVETSTGAEVTNAIASWINAFETHLAAGTLVPLEYQLAAGVGWEKVIEGIQDLENGKAAKKIVVKTQEE